MFLYILFVLFFVFLNLNLIKLLIYLQLKYDKKNIKIKK